MNFTLDKILSVLASKKYPIRDYDKKNYNINLVGIRHSSNVPNSFNDLMCVFWKFNGGWTFRTFPCTTDPGLHPIQDPQNPKGTAIVKEGHYEDVWDIGLHKGKYEALKQVKPITVIRDFDKDNILDFNVPNLSILTKKELGDTNKTIEWYDKAGKLVWREQTGIFGINGHRANENGKSVQVDGWSEGCTVLQNRQIFNPDNQAVKVFEFDYFMNLMKKKKESVGGFFSYSLLNEKDFN